MNQPNDAVDPDAVPKARLSSGDDIPMVGLGTFGSDHVSGEAIAEAVVGAAEVGYRHFDCASVYGNEDLIGGALQQVMANGIAREDLWVTSKLWNDKHAEEDVIPSFQQSLKDLKLDYLDLYLVHWPFPNFHPPHCDVSARSLDSKPYIHENYMKTWRQIEKLVEMGLVRNIGTSNMTIPKMELLLRDAAMKPVTNEMEIHPHLQQQELFDYVRSNDILPIGYCPLGSPNRPERDRMPGDTVDMEDPAVLAAAENHGIHPAAVCLKWGVQRGHAVIPMSANRRNYLSNLKCVTTDPLTDAEMTALSQIDKNCRLVKGHVFLWKDDQTWEDLWDLNGEITPA
jgi:alcohol dehydrogenase (NADP+)